ncbi:unnamed protein product [Linum tenue]|uniref:Vignain n=2 Tax=Linum tenue TaxID=586396 RepID=A0AAV0MEZ6_9ROSI|nr:unnamed protein product [Linum tenue]
MATMQSSNNLVLLSAAFLLLVLLAAMCPTKTTCRQLDDDQIIMRLKHEDWMVKHSRSYKDEAEKERRLLIFNDNARLVEAFNNNNNGKNAGFKLGLNKFADLTNEEFRSTYLGYKRRHSSSLKQSTAATFRYADVSAVPATMDWRKSGVVTPVKDQAKCVAAMEGITKLKTGKLISLSEQELIDCDVEGEDGGCEGGLMDNAFTFIRAKGGLATEAQYPYQAQDGTCNKKRSSSPAAKIKGYEDVPANSERALMQAVAHQPVSVAIEGGGFMFQLYGSGVFEGSCGTELDHAVTAVGYGTNGDGSKYWVLKNSWGKGWGEDGYMRIKKDVSETEGLCGLAMEASYPTA